MDDADLLAQAVPDLKRRTRIETLYADGGYGSPAADEQLNQHKVELIQTGIRGKAPDPDKLSLSQFTFTTTEKGKPLTIACPNGQEIDVQPGRTTGYIARFDPAICQTCPFAVQDRCRAKPGKKDPAFKLSFTQQEVNSARRRRRSEEAHQPGKNPRAAVEAAVWSVKHPFPAGKLPVRGLFRATGMLIASAAMANLRSIWRYEQQKSSQNHAPASTLDDFLAVFRQKMPAFSVGLFCFSC